MFRNFNNYASIAAAASLVGGACLIENSDATYKVMPNLVQAQTNASFLGMNTMSRFFSSASAHCNSQFYTTESVAKMPQWIRDGLGDTPYYSEEKNATFGGKNC
jgi:hypothetical protein